MCDLTDRHRPRCTLDNVKFCAPDLKQAFFLKLKTVRNLSNHSHFFKMRDDLLKMQRL